MPRRRPSLDTRAMWWGQPWRQSVSFARWKRNNFYCRLQCRAVGGRGSGINIPDPQHWLWFIFLIVILRVRVWVWNWNDGRGGGGEGGSNGSGARFGKQGDAWGRRGAFSNILSYSIFCFFVQTTTWTCSETRPPLPLGSWCSTAFAPGVIYCVWCCSTRCVDIFFPSSF